ncbi:MAG: hypothetical protein O3B94_04010 [Bacteroidetes bacterium]|nr:hypothetical protein [Bacteroidota bacterium]
MASLGKAARSIGANYVVLPSIPDEERLDIDAYHLMRLEDRRMKRALSLPITIMAMDSYLKRMGLSQ